MFSVEGNTARVRSSLHWGVTDFKPSWGELSYVILDVTTSASHDGYLHVTLACIIHINYNTGINNTLEL